MTTSTLSKKDAIAEAVKESLNGVSGPLRADILAERRHLQFLKLEDVVRLNKIDGDNPIVTVIPRAERKTRTSRSTWAHEYDVAILLQAYCLAEDVDRGDELSLKVEEIADFMQAAGAMERAVLMNIQRISLFNEDGLTEQHQFASMLTLTYRLERST